MLVPWRHLVNDTNLCRSPKSVFLEACYQLVEQFVTRWSGRSFGKFIKSSLEKDIVARWTSLKTYNKSAVRFTWSSDDTYVSVSTRWVPVGALKKKGIYKEKFMRIFHPFAEKPTWRNLHKILHDRFPRRHNQPCQILSQSGQGFWFCGGRIFGFLIRKRKRLLSKINDIIKKIMKNVHCHAGNSNSIEIFVQNLGYRAIG